MIGCLILKPKLVQNPLGGTPPIRVLIEMIEVTDTKKMPVSAFCAVHLVKLYAGIGKVAVFVSRAKAVAVLYRPGGGLICRTCRLTGSR